MGEAEAKHAQRMAEAITRMADKTESQVNAHARREKAVSKEQQRQRAAAKAEQQKHQKVRPLLFLSPLVLVSLMCMPVLAGG